MDNRSFILEVLNSQEKYKDTEVTREEAKKNKNVIIKNEDGCTKYFYREYESVDSDGFDKLCVREIAKRAIMQEKHLRIIKGILIAGVVYIVIKEILSLLIFLS